MWKPMMNFASDLVSGWWTSGKNTDDQKPDTVVSLDRVWNGSRRCWRTWYGSLPGARARRSSWSATGELGKSRTIRRTLESEGKKYVLLNSHATPMSLYRVLFENRDDKVVWLDDADSIYANMQVLGLLRSATWNDVERVVTYTSCAADRHSRPFRVQQPDRLLRRTAFRDGTRRSGRWSPGATSTRCKPPPRRCWSRCASWLRAVTGRWLPSSASKSWSSSRGRRGSRQVSMRLYEPSLKKLEYALQVGVDWRPLVRTQLDEIGYAMDTAPPVAGADEMDSLRQVMAEYSTVGEQQEAWCRAARRSRASLLQNEEGPGQGRRAGRHGAGGDGSCRLSLYGHHRIYPTSDRRTRWKSTACPNSSGS